ncbi:MAG: HdaA/DnaA family protein [Janthinobacterium lividum]
MMQYTFHLEATDQYHLDDFIVSSSNLKAYCIIQQWPISWGHLPYPNSVLIHGPSSSGKTYLTKIWQNRSKAYLLNKEEIFDSKALYSNCSFIMEDIEQWEEKQLFHYFNWISTNNKSLLLTTSNNISNFKLNDLSSRINSLTHIEIEAPDQELIKIFLFKLFSNHSIKTSSQVQEYLMAILPRNLNEIIKFVVDINEFALASKRNLTIPLIREFIQEITEH